MNLKQDEFLSKDDFLSLDEICIHCGCRLGSHHAGKTTYPYNYCPGHEGEMDWNKGPGTIFKGSGKYKYREK